MHWTLQASGRTDVVIERNSHSEDRGTPDRPETVTWERDEIVERLSKAAAKKREAELIKVMGELVEQWGCDFARLNTVHHGTIDLI